jgi:hypothetical protein
MSSIFSHLHYISRALVTGAVIGVQASCFIPDANKYIMPALGIASALHVASGWPISALFLYLGSDLFLEYPLFTLFVYTAWQTFADYPPSISFGSL